MGTWTEANYLERLQTPLKHALEASENACPDAEMMQAYAAGNASEFVRNAVGEHLKMCGECRGLAERIAAFDAAGANAAALTAQEQVEWANAEKRLDIEAENYARRSEVNFKRAAELEREAPRTVASAVDAQREAWVFPWQKTAWSLAAVAALVILGLVLTRRQTTAPSGAAQAPVAAASPSARPAVQPPIAVANDAGPNATSPAPGSMVNALTPEGTSANGSTASSAAKPHRTKPISSSAGNGTAVASKTAATDSGAANAPTEVAQNVVPTAAPSLSMSRGPSGRSPIGARTASNRTNAAPEPNTEAATSAPSQPLPATIHLLSGTRVWITLGTVTHETDANFAFTGTLFQPISGPGNTSLEKLTEVYGTGVMSGGKMSLYIKEFAIRGVHYRLISASGAANAAQAGGGAAVPFNAGQVQEMWLAAPADYEKVANP